MLPRKRRTATAAAGTSSYNITSSTLPVLFQPTASGVTNINACSLYRDEPLHKTPRPQWVSTSDSPPPRPIAPSISSAPSNTHIHRRVHVMQIQVTIIRQPQFSTKPNDHWPRRSMPRKKGNMHLRWPLPVSALVPGARRRWAWTSRTWERRKCVS